MRVTRIAGCGLAFPGWAVLFACAMLHAPRARAADPQAYVVALVPTGIRALDSTLKATSQLEALRKTAPVNPYGLIARARADRKRLTTVLDSFGYYDGTASVTIEGLPLGAESLGPRLSRLASGAEAHIRIAFSLGAPYRVGRIRIEGRLPPKLGVLDLKPGAVALAARVLAAGRQLEAVLQNHGYAFAKVAPPLAELDPVRHLIDLTFRVTTGPRVEIGAIRFVGLKRTQEAFVRHRLLLHTGEPYDAAAVDRARRDLLNLGLFSTVSVMLGRAPDSHGRVTITFDVKERARHTVAVNAAYSTDLGGSGGVSWENRHLSGHADALDLSATLINLGGTASTGLGYNTSAKYILPDLWHRGESLQFALSGLQQDLLAYTQQAETAGVTLSGRFSSLWSASAGVSVLQETDVQYETNNLNSGVTYHYTLATLPVSLIYDSTDLPSPLSDPTHGTRGALNLTPTRSLVGPRNATFEIIQVTLAHYFDVGKTFGAARGRTVLAMRVMAGVAFGASEFSLPPDQRFYAGGSGTVRGYRYQSVGPQFENTNPVGGTAMNAVNIELRQRIGRRFGAVLFADGGGVSEGHNPLAVSHSCTGVSPSRTAPSAAAVSCVGVGTGIRYYTPLGPIRLDVAIPTVHRYNDDKFEIYVGLGQAF